MNGCDHTSPSENAQGWIQALNADSSFNDFRIIHSNFTEYLKAVKSDLGVRSVPKVTPTSVTEIPLRPNEKKRLSEDWMGETMNSQVSLTTVTGEQKFGVEGLANILSTKIRQKQSNWRVQSLLERWVEPFSAFAWRLTEKSISPNIAKHKYDHDKIWYAWKTLLQNHPHDSIGGCSVTDVHEEVDMRFAKSEKVSQQLATDSVAVLAFHAGVQTPPHLQPGDHPTVGEYIKVVVFNPTNLDRTNDIVVGFIDMPRVSGSGNIIPKMTFFDAKTGDRVDGLLLRFDDQWDYMLPRVGFRQPYNVNRLVVAFPATVPPLGYSTYLVSPTVQAFSQNSPPGQNAIANDLLELSLSPEQQLQLVDTATKERLPFSLNFEDAPDHGDEYVTRPGAASTVSRTRVLGVFNTPVMSRMDLEMGFADSSTLQVFLFLWKGVRRVDIRITYTNSKPNHRLRASFDVRSLEGTLFEAESQFDVLDRGNAAYNGQQGFVNIWNQNSGKGIAIANRGLPEYQVAGGVVHMTLVRGTSQVGDWGRFPTSPSSQELGSHNFEFSYILYQAPEPEQGHQLARQFVHSLQLVQSWNNPGYQSHKDLINLKSSSLVLASTTRTFHNSGNPYGADRWLFPIQQTSDLLLPSRHSFFNVTPNFIEVSSIKKTEGRDSIILRFWNPKSTTAQIIVGAGFNYQEVWKCLLSEKRVSLLSVQPSSSSFAFEIGAKSVVTLEFV